jgi:hypothetical protein
MAASGGELRAHVVALLQAFLGGDPSVIKAVEEQLTGLARAPGEPKRRSGDGCSGAVPPVASSV